MRKIVSPLLLFVSVSAFGQANVPDHFFSGEPFSLAASAADPAPASGAGGAQADAAAAATPEISTKPLVVTHKGAFSPITSFNGITSNLNGCDPDGLYRYVQYKKTYIGGVTGCVTGDGSGNNHEIVGVQGFATSNHSSSEAVGGSFYGFAGGADGVHAFGSNPVVEDRQDSSKNLVLFGEEIDVQPAKAPANYNILFGLYVRLFNPFNAGGTYPASAITVGAGTNSPTVPAYWREGLTFFPGVISPTGVAININASGKATSSGNYDCPRILNAYEAYWTGSANAFEAWGMQCTIASSGANPTADYFKILHNAGNSPAGQAHYFDLTGGVSLQLEGSSSGSTVLSASATGGTLNLGSTNASVTSGGALSVASCKGCGLPGTIYSAAATALPACGPASRGEEAVVGDAANPAYMSDYKSGGAITAAVICSYNGRSYSWLTH